MSKIETHFIGLGGAGSNTIEYLFQKGIKGKFTCISNPKRIDLAKEIQFINFIPPGESYMIDGVEKFRKSDMKQKITVPDNVMNIFKNNDRFILLSGFGGYTGTFLTEELTFLLNKQQKNFLTISTLPFKMESRKSRKLAQKTINNLKHIANFKHINLEDLKLMYSHLTIDIFFEKVNEHIFEIYQNNTEA